MPSALLTNNHYNKVRSDRFNAIEGNMQRYKIVHHTYYNFSQPVTLGPHILLLRPREDHDLRIESAELTISPPATLLWHRDVEGNSVANATFSEPTQQLAIESINYVQQYNEQPLNFLVEDYALRYPFAYRAEEINILDPYRVLPANPTHEIVSKWLQQIWQKGEAIQTYTLLNRLCSHIYQTMKYNIREEPGVQSAAKTLSQGSGSCRDFALLFMTAGRCLGLAVRFVSGYLHVNENPATSGATHAWAEVYLPGAGWKGFDPTSGTIAGKDHIAVAVAVSPELVPPVAGSYTGAAKSNLEVGVWVSRI
jgi:transglutaminase-like putative cysteine protease